MQRSAGNQAVVRLLRQATAQEADEGTLANPPASWDALHTEIFNLLLTLTKLNATAPVIGERGDLAVELEALLRELGPPAEVPEARQKAIRLRLQVWKNEREADRKLAAEAWIVLTEEYQEELARLQASPERSDRRAAEILAERYRNGEERLRVAGRFARPEDAGPFAHMLAGDRHIDMAWAQEVVEFTRPVPARGATGGKPAAGGDTSWWPWTPFKVTAKLVHGAASGLHEAAHLDVHARQQEITKWIDTALRSHIRNAARTALALGDDPASVAQWSNELRDSALAKAREIGQQASKYERWGGKLHVAGTLMVWIDVGASVIDVVTSPPKEMPRKSIVHGSRILGGLAGAGVGARLGVKAGRVFGTPGVIVGGIVGVLAFGLAGAAGAKKIATFVTDLMWPPEDTYWEQTHAGH